MTDRQAEWNAETYHVVAKPHLTWGAKVLERVPTSGISTVLDAGCGTGNVTRDLLERLTDTTVFAVDYSAAMLTVAERELVPRFGDRVRIVRADLSELTPAELGVTVDLIFSTATFHWIKDHYRLFGRLFDLLNPGGHLVAQCGGGPNLKLARQYATDLMASPQFAHYYEDWVEPWMYADDEVTAKRLRSAGFVNVSTNLEYQPTVMPDAEAYREFVRTVIFREQLAKISLPVDKEAFVEQLVQAASEQPTPFELDYWRLNMQATKEVSGL